MGERERERERERQRQRQTDRQTDRDRETERQRETERDRENERVYTEATNERERERERGATDGEKRVSASADVHSCDCGASAESLQLKTHPGVFSFSAPECTAYAHPFHSKPHPVTRLINSNVRKQKNPFVFVSQAQQD